MVCIFAYIWLILMVNVHKSTIHEWILYGYCKMKGGIVCLRSSPNDYYTNSLWFQKYFIFYPLPGDDDIQVDFFFQTDWFNHHLHFGKLTWQWKITIFNREYIFKRSLFHYHVSSN